MPETIAGIQIPDSTLAREATELVRDCTSDLIYHHSRRTFIWGALRGLETGVSADPELHYVGAMFHDLGLTQTYRTDGPGASRSTAQTRPAASSWAMGWAKPKPPTSGTPSHCTPPRRFPST